MGTSVESREDGSIIFIPRSRRESSRFVREQYRLTQNGLPNNIAPKGLIEVIPELKRTSDEQVIVHDIMQAIGMSVDGWLIEAIVLDDIHTEVTDFNENSINAGYLGRILNGVAEDVRKRLNQIFLPARIALTSLDHNFALDDSFFTRRGAGFLRIPIVIDHLLPKVHSCIIEARSCHNSPSS